MFESIAFVMLSAHIVRAPSTPPAALLCYLLRVASISATPSFHFLAHHCSTSCHAFALLSPHSLQVNITKPTKEGWLEKQSRILKRWKRRWMVLQDNMLYSFKSERDYREPTEAINLIDYSSVKSSEDTTMRPFSFDVYSPLHNFSLVASSEVEKEDWIRAIGRAIVISRPHRDDEDD